MLFIESCQVLKAFYGIVARDGAVGTGRLGKAVSGYIKISNLQGSVRSVSYVFRLEIARGRGVIRCLTSRTTLP